MWELAFSIPIPNLTGLISGFCLGTLVTLAVIVGLSIWAKKQQQKVPRGISFEEIEALDLPDEQHSGGVDEG